MLKNMQQASEELGHVAHKLAEDFLDGGGLLDSQHWVGYI